MFERNVNIAERRKNQNVSGLGNSYAEVLFLNSYKFHFIWDSISPFTIYFSDWL